MKMNTESMIEKIQDFYVVSKKGEIYHSVIHHTEKILIEKALEESAGNQLSAAKILGINRNTLRAKMRKLNIDQRRFKE